MITHDLGVVAGMADTITVMYADALWNMVMSSTYSMRHSTRTPMPFKRGSQTECGEQSAAGGDSRDAAGSHLRRKGCDLPRDASTA